MEVDLRGLSIILNNNLSTARSLADKLTDKGGSVIKRIVTHSYNNYNTLTTISIQQLAISKGITWHTSHWLVKLNSKILKPHQDDYCHLSNVYKCCVFLCRLYIIHCPSFNVIHVLIKLVEYLAGVLDAILY